MADGTTNPIDALGGIGFDGPVSVDIWGDNPDELARASAAGVRELGVTAK